MITAEENVSGINLGFEAKIDDLFIALAPADIDEDGEPDPPAIASKARTRLFWKKQNFLGIIQ